MQTRRKGVLRLLALTTIAAVLVGLAATTSAAEDPVSTAATPRATCGPGSRPETSIQGRVPRADYDSGRAGRGYTCNTRPVGHYGSTGGFKVLRYVDGAGRACAYYDSTLMLPIDVPYNVGTDGVGVFALDMSDPARPVRTATLSTPAMDTPHESLVLNRRRGLLVAAAGNAATQAGQVDVYDVTKDCRHPVLRSSTPTGILGHESGFAPDGRTLYVSSTSGQTLTAVDLSDPAAPKTLMVKTGVVYHGMRVSADGNRLYVANIGYPGNNRMSNGGLVVLDVSQVQRRAANPQAPVVSTLSWRNGSIPQVPEPFTVKGHHYLLEVDEFANFGATPSVYQPDAPVGAARIIDIEDERHPTVVSNLRLQVNQLRARKGPERYDPGAQLPIQGYTAHYCSVPRRADPGIVACSFILSGLRIFDVRDPRHPREVGYYNQPRMPGTRPAREGGYAMSAPAWDLRRKQIWYTDANTGFHVVRLTNRIAPRW